MCSVPVIQAIVASRLDDDDTEHENKSNKTDDDKNDKEADKVSSPKYTIYPTVPRPEDRTRNYLQQGIPPS